MDEAKREPIVGIRKPITGLRKSIRLEDLIDKNMTWEIQYKKLNNYIKFVAAQVVSGLPSAMMSAEDLYQEGLILLYTCFDKYRFKKESEFHAIYKSSCWRLLKGFCYKKKELQTVDLDDVFDLGYSDSTISDLYEEYRVKQVVELLEGNEVALKIFSEILTPSPETCREAEMDYARKECIKSQGHRVCVPSSIEVKPDILKRVLKLSNSEFSKQFKKLKSAVYAVYSVDYDIKSYQESSYLSQEEFDSYYQEIVNLVTNLKSA